MNMVRYDRTVEWDKNMIKYKVLGSPDVYAVQYNTGNVITTAKYHKPIIKWLEEEFEYGCGIPDHENCTKKFPLNDLREVDNIGKFGFPKRYRSPQFM